MLELCKESFLELGYDPEDRILYANWKGYPSFDSCTAGAAQMLDAIREHQVEKILNDNTQVRGLWMDAAQWGARAWFPRAQQCGMRRFAWVYSPAKFSQISANTALAHMDPEAYGVEVFFTAEEALQWLRDAPR